MQPSIKIAKKNLLLTTGLSWWGWEKEESEEDNFIPFGHISIPLDHIKHYQRLPSTRLMVWHWPWCEVVLSHQSFQQRGGECGECVHHLRIGGQQRGDDVAQSSGATTVSVHFKLQAPLLKNPNNCPPSRYFSRISLRYYPCSISFPISFENNFTVWTLTHQETLFVCWAVCCLSVGWVYLLHCLELP